MLFSLFPPPSNHIVPPFMLPGFINHHICVENLSGSAKSEVPSINFQFAAE